MYHDSNSRPLDRQSPPISNRPGIPSKTDAFFAVNHGSLTMYGNDTFWFIKCLYTPHPALQYMTAAHVVSVLANTNVKSCFKSRVKMLL